MTPTEEGYYIVNNGKKILYFDLENWYKPCINSNRKLCGYYRFPKVTNVKIFRHLTKQEKLIHFERT